MTWWIEACYWGRSVDITPQLLASSPEGQITYSPQSPPEVVAAKTPRFLRITNRALPQWRPLLVAVDCPFTLRRSATHQLSQLRAEVVYFVNCYTNPRYIYMVRSQLKELAKTRLLENLRCRYHIVSSGYSSDREAIAATLRTIFGDDPRVRHTHTVSYNFEYPGIRKVWELAQEDQSGYILYFHSRGITHLRLGRFRRNRQDQEKRLFRRVIWQWQKNLLWLENVLSAEKLGLNCGGNGWVWYNFWWARAAYLHGVEEPHPEERRHYYEDWLGRHLAAGRPGEYDSNLAQCLSLVAYPHLCKYHL
ncbi:MAG: hypothetical protein N2Z22_00255, partial [Turneriella sp.]|nr:hypothetical protein [Turneriella sp.]